MSLPANGVESLSHNTERTVENGGTTNTNTEH